MTDNLILNTNFNWDQETDQVDESGGVTIITDYGAMQYLGSMEVTMFATGQKVTLPNFQIDGKPYERGGMKAGHSEGGKNATAHFIAYFGKAFKDDADFVSVRVFTTLANIPVTPGTPNRDIVGENGRKPNWVADYPVINLNERQKAALAEGKTAWISDWSNLQFAALREMPAEFRAKFQGGQKVYFKADNWNTGSKPRDDQEGRTNSRGEERKYYDHYWFNIVEFPSEAAMLAARTEAKGTQQLNGAAIPANMPAVWLENVKPENVDKTYQELLNMIRQGEPGKYLATAEALSLIQGGKPALRPNSDQPIDLYALFVEAGVLNMPAAMSPFAALYK